MLKYDLFKHKHFFFNIIESELHVSLSTILPCYTMFSLPITNNILIKFYMN